MLCALCTLPPAAFAQSNQQPFDLGTLVLRGEKIGRGFVDWGASQLAVESEVERAKAAAQLLIQVEGSVLLRSLGLDDVVESAYDG